jgi:hypothetical protein
MATLISSPSKIEAAGTKPKVIEEFVGRKNSDTHKVSVARMKSPSGWEEPGQTPKFDEYTIVLAGTLRVATRKETFERPEPPIAPTPTGLGERDCTLRHACRDRSANQAVARLLQTGPLGRPQPSATVKSP